MLISPKSNLGVPEGHVFQNRALEVLEALIRHISSHQTYQTSLIRQTGEFSVTFGSVKSARHGKQPTEFRDSKWQEVGGQGLRQLGNYIHCR